LGFLRRFGGLSGCGGRGRFGLDVDICFGLGGLRLDVVVGFRLSSQLVSKLVATR
jgi:hypothetical protein